MKTKNHILASVLGLSLIAPRLSHAFYNPSTGRWLSRDPLTDESPQVDNDAGNDDASSSPPECAPLLCFKNNPISSYDALGLWPSSDHFLYLLPEPTPLTHQNAIVRGIPGLSSHDYDILKSASVFVDSFQGTALSYMHAMSDPQHSPAQAKVLANSFVSDQITRARILLCVCPSRRDAALFQFGQALHTILDATSPAHTGFQIWKGVKGHKKEAIAHVLKENWDPGWFGTNSHLDKATAWLWTFFQCPPNAPPFPTDWFANLGYDALGGQ